MPRRGQDGFWRIIRQLDAAGPWSARDVDRLSNVDSGTVRDFIRRLVAGGYAEGAGERPNESRWGVAGWAMPSPLYRLLKAPADAPRLRRDGTELPETQNGTLWRVLKMAKVVTASELAELASVERDVKRHVAHRYLRQLAEVGIIARVSNGAPGEEARFRLARNTGARAPRVTRGHRVHDPNAGRALAKLGSIRARGDSGSIDEASIGR